MTARRGSAARVVLSLAAALVMLLPAVPARAATFAFASPQATSKFNQGIEFTVRLSAAEAPARVDVQLLLAGDIGPFVQTLASRSAAGTSTLRYTLDTSGSGHLMPNSPVTITWVAYPQGGGPPVASDPFTYRYEDDTQSWESLRDGIVTVHWAGAGSRAFAQRAAGVAAKAMQDGADALRISETKPVDFYIYPDATSFRAALGSGARENVAGEALPETRTMVAEATSDSYIWIVITHELTHVVVDDATHNAYRFVPRWLNEGFATYMSEGNSGRLRASVSDAIASGDLLPLSALGWQFPAEFNKTTLAYAESVSAVDYLARQYGKDALTSLIRAYRSGPTDDEAMQAAIGMDLAAFQREWLASIGAPTPSPFGPQPAPAGPLPSDWVAAASPTVDATPAPTGAGATKAPGATVAPPLATPAPSAAPVEAASTSVSGLALVLVAVMAVSAMVLAGLVAASRRSSP